MRRFPVEVVSRPKDWSKVSLKMYPGEGGGFELWHDLDVVATCSSAKALSEWALDHGAREVRWDFDLAIVQDGHGR